MPAGKRLVRQWLTRGALAAALAAVIAPGARAAGPGAPRPVNPFGTAAIRAFLGSRSGDVTAAVENLGTDRTYLWNPRVAEHTASIVKVDILETLLHQLHGAPIPPSVAATAQGMIENSNNDDATDLWNRVGGAPAVAAYDRLVGMNQTTPNSAWGLTTTTPRDQILLLRQLVLGGDLLDPGARDYELSLMEHVEADQDWGVSGGVPAGAVVALKNGWLPLPGQGWQVNSIGWIHGEHRDYLLAIMTGGDPSEAYGIDTIQGVASLVWRDLREQKVARRG